MKKLLLIFIIGFIGFTSCDGRKSHNKTLVESIKDSFDVDIYKPEGFVERDVDTLISNGFRVRIKTFVDSTRQVTYNKTEDKINHKTHYKNFKFEILVEKEGKLIYKDSFDKPKANKVFGFRADFVRDSPFYNFDKLAVLKSIEVDDEPSFKDRVMIKFIYAIPETDRYTDETLFINEDGSTNVVITKVN